MRSTIRTFRAGAAILLALALAAYGSAATGNITTSAAATSSPAATVGDVFFKALKGTNPLLAPGILALAGMLALAATYYHPAGRSGSPPAIHIHYT